MRTEAAAKKDTQKLQRAIIDGLEDVKAQDIQVFDTEHLSPLFERVIVASGTSNRQTKALAASVLDAVREAEDEDEDEDEEPEKLDREDLPRRGPVPPRPAKPLPTGKPEPIKVPAKPGAAKPAPTPAKPAPAPAAKPAAPVKPAPAKPAAKAPAKPAAKAPAKPAAKPAAKKPAAKRVAGKKAVPKPVAKTVVVKSVARKAPAKKAAPAGRKTARKTATARS